MSEEEPRGVLAGLRVLEIASDPPAQIAGMLFADLGADVVHLVDTAEGSIAAADLPGWLCRNRGKTLATGHGDTDRLLARADVLLHDLHPVPRAAAGLDGATLRGRYPALVDVWLAPIAARGRWAELPGDQLLLDALSGFAAHHPATDERPVASVVPTRHSVQGALAVVAALAGVIARDRDTHGRSATTSGLHAEAATLATLVSRSLDGAPVISPGKSLQAGPYFRLYQAGDAKWFYLAALSPDLFIRALEVIDCLDLLVRPDVAGEFTHMMRPDVGIAIGSELEAVFASAPADEWIQRFRDADVPVAAVLDPNDWLTGDVMAHACPPVERMHPRLGPILMPGTPLSMSQAPPVVGEVPVFEQAVPAAEVWTDVDDLPTPSGPIPGADDRPLGHLRVIDASSFLAAPFVSTLLARHGADVVKVEPSGGDPYSVYSTSYGNINEHKQRLRIDLSDPAGRDEFLELVGHCDVVVDNLVAASLARLGLTPDRFEEANPAAVRCSITAYGADGPFTDLPGFDPIMQSLSGLAAVQGGLGRPITTAAPVHDVATGCLGAIGALAALWANHRGRWVGRVYASLAATSTFLQAAELTTYGGRAPRAVGGPNFAGPSPTHRFYAAADRWLAIAATSPADRRAVLTAFAIDDQLDDDMLAARLQEAIGGLRAATVIELLESAGVAACTAIERVELDDPFLVENDYSHVFKTPDIGRFEAVSGYTDWDHVARPTPRPSCELIADRAAILERWS